MRMLRNLLIVISCVFGALLLFIALSVLPINRYDYTQQKFYSAMTRQLDALQPTSLPSAEGFSVGFAKVKLTPAQRTATAGYGNRKGKLYSSIHDSLYVRAMVVQHAAMRVAIVSADLLIIPPTVTALLEKELPAVGFSLDNTYLGATHTHNSIGNWGEGATAFLYGAYNDSIVHFIADQIKEAVRQASRNVLPAQIAVAQIPMGKAVGNRLNKAGEVDSLMHIIEIKRSDSTKLLLMNYAAHATCLYSRNLEISRDYPGALVDALEKRGYHFAMFMAGAVGSHGCRPPAYGWSCLDWMTDQIVNRFEDRKNELTTLSGTALTMYRVPLILPEPQAKISEDWKIRPWLFRKAFGEYPVFLTALRMGDVVMLGTPCDYSGELTSSLYTKARENQVRVMVTSFNGGYIGYITPDKYYDYDHYETRLMNWYGPGSGSYMTAYLEKLLGTAVVSD
ncbi:MAG: neutral/alkaline non-lysosomal ceramidase N-terminal domain-containing protein [Cyclobacteriaceae bacterium]|nr:neutral/alkaline non-lysosomal ceramidase N-terminal domain-containing protein [Cyclobacteriaceae bacterium]